MEYTELKNFIESMTEEINGIKEAIRYQEQFLMDESPMVPQHISELKTELSERTEDLESAIAYASRLAAY